MKVLVTGASGFLGSWVVRSLLAAGDQPRALVRATSQRESLAGLPVEVVPGDVLERRSLARAMKSVDAVVHLAGFVSLRRRDRTALFRVNVAGTHAVLEQAASRGLRILHVSTIGTIGLTSEPVVLDERETLSPDVAALYPYAESKLAAERVALDFAADGADVVILNPGWLLGPGDRRLSSTRFVHHFLRGEARFCPEGGTSLGDVRSVAAAFPRALRQGRRGERYILAGINRTYREIFDALARASGCARAWSLPSAIAPWLGLACDVAALWTPHPFEEMSLGTVAYATRFNFCDSAKASAAFGYTPGDLEPLVEDTVADHLAGQAASPA